MSMSTDLLETLWIAGSPKRSPIVFLHEGLGSVSLWRDWPAKLCAATGRAGFLYSRLGYGQSARIHDVRGLGRLAPDYLQQEALQVLPQLLAQQFAAQGYDLQLQPPVLLGHSDGGSIALVYAAHFAVQACIVLAPHVLVEDLSVQAITLAKQAYEQGDLRAKLAKHHADVDCAFWQWNDVWLSPAFRSFDIRPDCARIKAPLLALQGLEDAYGSLVHLEEIAARAPQTLLRTLANCRHSPHKDQPQQCAQLVIDFLKEQVDVDTPR
jgi:pimeloyl-ACP methyl ester carboxylesterase